MLALGAAAPLDDEKECAHGGHRRQNVGELRSYVIGHVELGAGEGDAAQGGGGEHAAQALPTAHDEDEVGGHEERDGGADAADAAAQAVERESGSEGQGGDGNGDGAEGDGGGVGEQADGGGIEGLEAEAGEHGGGHCDRRAEAGRAFDEGAEGEGDEEGLQARVCGEVADGVFQDFEFAAFERDAVEEDGAEDDPADGEETEGGAIGDGAGEQSQGHAVDTGGNDDGGGETGERRDPGGLAEHTEEEQQSENGKRCKEGREGQTIADGSISLLPHNFVTLGCGFPFRSRRFRVRCA